MNLTPRRTRDAETAEKSSDHATSVEARRKLECGMVIASLRLSIRLLVLVDLVAIDALSSDHPVTDRPVTDRVATNLVGIFPLAPG